MTGFLQQFVFLGRLAITHLCLHVLDLLLKEVIALLLVDILSSLVAYLGLKILQINLAIQHLHRHKQTLLHGVYLKKILLLLMIERHVGAHEIERHHRIGDVLNGEISLVGNILADGDILANEITEVGNGGLELTILLLGKYLFESGYLSLKIG